MTAYRPRQRTHWSVLLIAMGCVAALAGCGSQSESESESDTPDRPQRTGFFVNPEMADFGVVPPNSVHETTFTIHNNTSNDVRILAARPTCKCTTLVDIDGEVLSPGRQIELPASLELTARPGEKTATIQIMYETNGARNMVEAKLRAEVQLAVRAEPPYVDALRGTQSGVITVASVNDEPFTILSSNGQPPEFANYNPETEPPQSSYQLRWRIPNWPRDLPCDGVRLWWIVETDHPDAAILPCRIRHECTGSRSDPNRHNRGWIFHELVVNAQRIPPGESRELTIEIEMIGDRRIAINGVRSLHESASAELLDTSYDATKEVTTLRVRFTPDSDFRGMLYAPVEVQSQTGSHAVAVVASVRP